MTPVDEIEAVRCPHRPEELLGKPIGMHHCPACGCMCVAGVPHEATGHDEDCLYWTEDES